MTDPVPAYGVDAENAVSNRAFKFGSVARDEYDPKKKGHKGFVVNRITTSKYTPWNFLPKSIYGQFRRLANAYFLGMSLLMLVGAYTDLFASPISWTTTFLSLIAIMVFTMVMQIKDDVKRHMNDAKVDARDADTVNGKTIWKDVKVGDLIVVRNQEFFPADVVLLTSSSKGGSCYIETSNIDGETNLKIRSSVPKISSWLQSGKLGDLDAATQRCADLNGTIEYQLPNASVNAFAGVFTNLKGGSGAPTFARSDCVLNDKQQLLRGSCLRNTKWIIGLVVYTGEESKVAMNSKETPEKMSNLEKVVNTSMKVIMTTMVILVVITNICAAVWRSNKLGSYEDANRKSERFWYLFPNSVDEDDWYDLPQWLGRMFTYAILYNNFVPISLYVTLELINMYHAGFINNDKNMYDPETQTAARARTMNLCSELGQIQYIFSDKTGTLTANIMEFKRCSIGGKMFGTLDTKHFESKELFSTLKSGKGDVCDAIVNFMTVMSVGHTVVAEPDKKNEHGVHYEAESPDEGALVEGAATCGFRFVNRSPDTITIRYEGVTPTCQSNGGKKMEKTFKMLAINAFNSTRKRSSMLVETSEGKIMLLCKGADNIMLARARKDWDNKTLKSHLTVFSQEGLRTLVMGVREITPQQRDDWLKKYREANGATSGRKKKMMDVAEMIEKDMDIVGASAIEDKLQDGVPDCIADVRRAGVKLWVLTGDKMETAINIGYSCRLLDAEPGKMRILKMKANEEASTKQNLDEVEQILSALSRQIDEAQEEDRDPKSPKGKRVAMEYKLSRKDMRNLALVITGPTLAYIMDPVYPWHFKGAKKKVKKDEEEKVEEKEEEEEEVEVTGSVDLTKISPEQKEKLKKEAEDLSERLKSYLLNIGRACAVVVACRVSPLQKSLVVKLVKEGVTPTPVTLAIGDGANDVSMIKEAHVGVGISGREGLQAANSADFSIAQFRFLKTLLFVHGRYDYRRLSKVILYSFYKNVVLVLTIFYYNFYTGFSGQPMYDDWLYSGFNLFLFVSPVMLGIYDVDVSKETIFEIPQLYMSGRLQLDLNTNKMIETIALSVINSLVIMLFSSLSYPTLDDGINNGVYLFGTLVFSNLVFSMQYRCLFIGHTFNKNVIYGTIISIFLLFLFFLLYGGAICLVMGDPATFYYYVPMHLMGQPIYWISVLGTIGICASFDIIAEYLRLEFAPNLIDLCVEVERSERAKDKKTQGIRSIVSRRIRIFGQFLGIQKPVSHSSSSKKEAQDTKTKEKSPPDFTADPPKLNTKRSMLSTHELHMGHDETDEVDMSFPDDAHTGPLMLDHLASVHNLVLSDHDVSAVTDDSDSKTKESSTRGSTHAIDIESKESETSLLGKRSTFTWYNPMTWCNQNGNEKSEEPPEFIDTPFYQQTVPSKQIFVTARGAAIAYFLIGAMLLVLGGILYDAAEKVVFMDTSYSGRLKGEEGDFGKGKAFYAHADCGNNTLANSYNETTKWYNVREGTTCTIKMRIPFKMEAPIAVYYRLTSFYQNYNSYFSSRDSLQLRGQNSDAQTCAAVNSKYNRIGVTQENCDPATDSGCEYMFPCGLVSNSMFNDTFTLETQGPMSTCTCASADEDQIPERFNCDECQTWPKTDVSLRTDSIYWSSDNGFYDSYGEYGNEANVSYLAETYSSTLIDTSKDGGIRDPRYLVWMRPAAQPDFKKIYAEIDEDIPANSEVTFTITSRFPAFFYDGTKHIILASVNWQGPSKSYIMAWLFLGFGIYAVTMSLAIAYKMASCPRTPGTEGYVDSVANDDSFIPEKDDWMIKNIMSGVAQSTIHGIMGDKKENNGEA